MINRTAVRLTADRLTVVPAAYNETENQAQKEGAK